MFKKIVALAVIAAAGYVAYNRFSSAQSERDLWNEATSTPA